MALLGIAFLWNPVLRTARSVLFLTLIAVVYIAAANLPAPLVPWVRSAAAVALAAGLLFFPRFFSALPAEDENFIRALDDVNTSLNEAAAEFEQSPSQVKRWRGSLWDAMNQLTSLSPPSEEWASARAELLGVLRRRIELLDQGSISEEERRDFVTRKQRAQEMVAAARAKRTSFWRR